MTRGHTHTHTSQSHDRVWTCVEFADSSTCTPSRSATSWCFRPSDPRRGTPSRSTAPGFGCCAPTRFRWRQRRHGDVHFTRHPPTDGMEGSGHRPTRAQTKTVTRLWLTSSGDGGHRRSTRLSVLGPESRWLSMSTRTSLLTGHASLGLFRLSHSVLGCVGPRSRPWTSSRLRPRVCWVSCLVAGPGPLWGFLLPPTPKADRT